MDDQCHGTLGAVQRTSLAPHHEQTTPNTKTEDPGVATLLLHVYDFLPFCTSSLSFGRWMIYLSIESLGGEKKRNTEGGWGFRALGISFTHLALRQGWRRTPTSPGFSGPVSGPGRANGPTLPLLLEILMGRMNGVGGGGSKRGEYMERGGVGRDFPEGERGDGELNGRIYGIENEFLNNLLVRDVVSDCEA